MLNQIINIFWTTLSFVIVGTYWGRYLAEQRSPSIMAVFVLLSILTSFIPSSWIDKFTLSKSKKTYERIGVNWLLFFVQNGILVNSIQKKQGKRPGLIHNRKQAENYLKTIRMQERFHYCCFVLFTLSTVSAFMTGKKGIALLILLCNVSYNVYPMLLQQYNRIRINRLLMLAMEKHQAN
jgi:hypothetical protein